MTERRKAARLQDRDLVVLTWGNSFGYLKQLANVENVSELGLGLIVGKPLPVATKVTVSYGVIEVFGIVRHQSRRELGFFLGIEFEENTQVSAVPIPPELLVPQHEAHQQERQ